ncbi:MAG: hypothetical protein P8I51_03535 [Polaribacter sp.]|jgi:polyhydroxybutyrate depolymerase|nr:hypothetical protein [Polaribacter sp.]MDG1953948.1 hypothetical protein [Polaribacter sp.]MDG2073282.1 hypothetical protein [Polaribacter sp.]
MKKLLLILICIPQLLFSQVVETELKSLSPGINDMEIEYNGLSRRLLITTPKTYDNQKKYSILFCFHGAGGKADKQSKRWSPHVDERNIIVISVEAVQPQAKWNFSDNFHKEYYDDVGFISKVVQTLIEVNVADSRAIYATGHSSGGLFCWRLAKESDLFAALAPQSCGMLKGSHEPDENTKPVSVMQVIGDQDKSFNGSVSSRATMYSAVERIKIWREFNDCNTDPKITNEIENIEVSTYTSSSGDEVVYCKVFGEGHHIKRELRDAADLMVLDFLLSHKKK